MEYLSPLHLAIYSYLLTVLLWALSLGSRRELVMLILLLIESITIGAMSQVMSG